MAVGRHAALGHPPGLALFLRDQTHDLLGQSLADGFGLDVRGESVFIFLLPKILEELLFVRCHVVSNVGQRYEIKLQNHNTAGQICTFADGRPAGTGSLPESGPAASEIRPTHRVCIHRRNSRQMPPQRTFRSRLREHSPQKDRTKTGNFGRIVLKFPKKILYLHTLSGEYRSREAYPERWVSG